MWMCEECVFVVAEMNKGDYAAMMMLMMCVKQHFIYQSQKYKHAA
jgi:hypothetical protein